MKRLLLLFLTFLTLSCCVCNKPAQQPVASPHSLMDKTVTLVMKASDDQYHMFCTGVWISQTQIVTAKHCAQHAVEEGSPVGALIHFKTVDQVNIKKNELDKSEPHMALVLAVSEKSDVAILSSIDNVPGHDYADISAKSVQVGDEVSIVGHTGGLQYTFLKGLVSAIREDDDGVKLLQISSAAYKGNSGGGAFDKNGKLVGICSAIFRGAPEVVVFVDREEILKLLE